VISGNKKKTPKLILCKLDTQQKDIDYFLISNSISIDSTEEGNLNTQEVYKRKPLLGRKRRTKVQKIRKTMIL
jgi:hypothetical protein